jgi:hypothetical protein
MITVLAVTQNTQWFPFNAQVKDNIPLKVPMSLKACIQLTHQLTERTPWAAAFIS